MQQTRLCGRARILSGAAELASKWAGMRDSWRGAVHRARGYRLLSGLGTLGGSDWGSRPLLRPSLGVLGDVIEGLGHVWGSSRMGADGNAELAQALRAG